MAPRQPDPPGKPGPTQAGTNLPTQHAGLTDDEKREQEFLKEKLAEEQKEEERKRAAVKHAQEKGASAREVGDPPPVVFNIQNIGGEHLDLFTGSVNLDGTPRWNPLGHIDPGDSRTFVGPIEGLKIKQGE